MEDIGVGAGLGALGFWAFIGAIVVAGIWDSIRKREAQHETLRRIIESGQPMDEEFMDKLLSLSSGGDSKQVDRDLKVGGLITVFVAPGLALMGWVLSIAVEQEELLLVLTGVAGLVGCVGIGLLVASYVVARWYTEDDGRKSNFRT